MTPEEVEKISHIHVPDQRFGPRSANLSLCRQSVYSSGSFGSHQCNNKAKVTRGGYGFCGLHDPVKVQERERVRLSKMKHEADMKAEHLRKAEANRAYNKACRELVEEIAKGHNDARGAALSLVVEYVDKI